MAAVVEVGLAAWQPLHLSLTLAKTLPTAVLATRRRCAAVANRPLDALASRSKMAAGLITLGFLALHLQQLRWPRPSDGLDEAAC